MTEELERQAQEIAGGGREALLDSLRPAFRDAAATHADVLKLTDEQLEEMVQGAADRADGLQWRRALATVATDRLGLTLGEALLHPAVARAQALVGAPSYEDSLAELRARVSSVPVEPVEQVTEPVGTAVMDEPEIADLPEVAAEPPYEFAEPEPGPELQPEPELEPQPEPELQPEPEPEPEPEPKLDEPFEVAPVAEEPIEHELEEPAPPEPQPELETALEAETEPEEPPEQDAETELEEPPEEAGRSVTRPLRIAAVHVGGIANLEPNESGIELRLSPRGLDITHSGGTILGRVGWREIRALDVLGPRGLRRRRRGRDVQLLLRTNQGEATFLIPGLSTEELNEHLAPVLKRHLRRR